MIIFFYYHCWLRPGLFPIICKFSGLREEDVPPVSFGDATAIHLWLDCKIINFLKK